MSKGHVKRKLSVSEEQFSDNWDSIFGKEKSDMMKPAIAKPVVEKLNKTKPVIEIDMEELLDSWDWAEVFGDKSAGNTDNQTDGALPGVEIDLTPPTRKDVVEIIAAVEGENDGPSWVGVFRLKDGRYLVATGWCDYTGWDCQGGNSLTVAHTLKQIIAFGLSDQDRTRLFGTQDPSKIN